MDSFPAALSLCGLFVSCSIQSEGRLSNMFHVLGTWFLTALHVQQIAMALSIDDIDSVTIYATFSTLISLCSNDILCVLNGLNLGKFVFIGFFLTFNLFKKLDLIFMAVGAILCILFQKTSKQISSVTCGGIFLLIGLGRNTMKKFIFILEGNESTLDSNDAFLCFLIISFTCLCKFCICSIVSELSKESFDIEVGKTEE